MSKKQVKVAIDSREDDDVIADLMVQLREHDDVEDVWVEQLDAGDLKVGTEEDGWVGFERKAPGDYVSSMLKQRLNEQAVKMDQMYEHSYVLFEGDLRHVDNPMKATESNIAPAAVRGSMASLTAREGLPVIPVSNRDLLADMAVRLTRKHIEESSSRLALGAVTGSEEPTAKKMYGCIPGVGPELAGTLYREWPSISQFVNHADRASLQELDGVGEAKAKQIMEGFL